jgi:hypothetical protein
MVTTKGYNSFHITEVDLKLVRPYLRDTAETPKEVKCEVKGTWPKQLEGTFLR